MWLRWFVCAPCGVETLSVPRLWQAAPLCWRRQQRHLDAEDATPAVIGSMTVKRDGLRLLISPLLFSSAPNLLRSFRICCFSASARFLFSSCLLFDPSYLLSHSFHRPPFLHSDWREGVYTVAPAWILHVVCVKASRSCRHLICL